MPVIVHFAWIPSHDLLKNHYFVSLIHIIHEMHLCLIWDPVLLRLKFSIRKTKPRCYNHDMNHITIDNGYMIHVVVLFCLAPESHTWPGKYYMSDLCDSNDCVPCSLVTIKGFKTVSWSVKRSIILYLTGLNYYGLLMGFWNRFFTLYRCVCVHNVILHHFRYKEVRFNCLH